MRTVEIKSNKRGDYVETICKCGCGLIIRTKLQKYISLEHYGKAISEMNKQKRLGNNKC